MLKKHLGWFLALIFVIPIFLMIFRKNNVNVQSESSVNKEIVTSCFPVYNIARELLSGINEFKLSNLTSDYLGDHSCLHNYSLTTDNAKSLENASVVIINGAGFEPFVDKIPDKKIVIDSSKEISIDEKNPYIWISINNYINQVKNVADELSGVFPDYKSKISKNASLYSEKLQGLKDEWSEKFTKFKGSKIASLSEKFNYLFRDLGLNTIELKSSHAHESVKSADVISYAVKKIKDNDLKFFISTKNDNNINEIIEKESGAKCVVLRSLDNPLDGSYIGQMKSNLDKIYENINS